ncbi:MAG TPA: hypothetical protein VFF06_05005 [Polyangia bacterium]|nr:hypothetical protein [Polyangia bacterium]
MKPLTLEGLLRIAAFAACAMVAGMFALFVATGVGQDPLQFMHPPDAYVALLLKDPPMLRLCLGLDNAFIVFYSTVFVLLGALLVKSGASRAVTVAAVGALAATGLLDMIENFHFMAMLQAAEQGLGVTLGEIRFQVIETLLKFHVSYLGLFLLGFVLPKRTRLERALAYASWYVQLPVGILIYVAPPAVAFPLVLVRFTYFVGALVALAIVYGGGAERTPIARAAQASAA